MFTQLGVTAEGLSRGASSLVLRIGTDAHLYDDPDDVNMAPLLDSRFDSDKIDALKRLLALIAQGADVAHFFPQVVKNAASQSLEVKKLVYLYLLHYAEKRQNEALLSINCFQRDLSDTNPLVRALALRAMAGIRLHLVAPLVLAAISKCARDPSAYVRKCAANALPKLHDLQQEDSTAPEELVSILLSDHSPGVVGAAAAAFKTVCPNNLPLLGKHYRRLCEMLPDVEEWGQIVLIDILLRYVVARHGLVQESIMCSSTTSPLPDNDYSAASNLTNNHSDTASGDTFDSKLNELMFKYYIGHEEVLPHTGVNFEKLDHSVTTSSKNSDVAILLRCTAPLLWSQNSAVVLAAAGVHWIIAPKDEVSRIVKPLLFTLRSSSASKYVILCNILVFAKVAPAMFAPHFEDFLIHSSEAYQIKALKLEILANIATASSISDIFEEFEDYLKDPDRRFVADTVAAVGLCAQRVPSVGKVCMNSLLALILQESSVSWVYMDSKEAVLVQAVMSIKTILKQDPVGYEMVIVRLFRTLDAIKDPSARALIVWMAGEYSSVGQVIPAVIPTLLRYLAWSFPSEEVETKLQIINTSAKVFAAAEGEKLEAFKRILGYILELAKYDLNYDVRDRSRSFEMFLRRCNIPNEESRESTPWQLMNRILCGKIQITSLPARNFRFFLPGCLSQVVLHAAPGYVPLPLPCSLPDENTHERSALSDEISNSDSSDTGNPGEYSGSSDEESGSNHDSHPSVSSSVDSEVDTSLSNPNTDWGTASSINHDLSDLMSKSALESWLNEQPGESSVQKSVEKASASISVNDVHISVKPKVHSLLDPTNSSGLSIQYSFSNEISLALPSHVCVELVFKNHSAEQMAEIVVKDAESHIPMESANHGAEKHESDLIPEDVPNVMPMEEIELLDPGQSVKRTLQIRFSHHLLPLKFTVFCNEKKHLTKMWPDIGYFLRPLSMTLEAFLEKESHLPGMFECSKSCTFHDHVDELEHGKQHPLNNDRFLAVCRHLASKVLSNANVHLGSITMPVSSDVDDASGLSLRFSSEILSSSFPCLITLTSEGKCSEPLKVTVKVNCEDTVFGLNLLNRVVAFLQS